MIRPFPRLRPRGRAPGIVPLALLAGCAVAFPNPARAARGEAKLLLHLVPDAVAARARCDVPGVTGPADIRTRGPVGPGTWTAYILVVDIDRERGLAGVQFGLDYDGRPGRGIDILSWSHCATLEFSGENWPAAGSGNLLTWSPVDDCRRSDPVVVGVLRLVADSPDSLRLTPRPVDGLAAVAACGTRIVRADENVDRIRGANLGRIDFGNGPGWNPWAAARADSIDSPDRGR